MHPVIIKFGFVVIHSYGLMLAISFLLGIALASYRAKKNNLDPNVISDVGFWVILSAVLGARLYYVFLHFEEFKGDFFSIINPFQEGSVGIGGLVMLGGLFGAVLAGILFFKIKKIPFLPYADAVAPTVGIGLFLTRIGCFLNGCCYGMPTNEWYGVHFPPHSPAGYYQLQMKAEKLISSQLISSFGGLIIAVTILTLSFIYKDKLFVGFQFYLMIAMYAILRFLVDFSRFYSNDERLLSLSHNQIFCILLFVVFAGLIVKNLFLKEENNNSGEDLKIKDKI